MNEEELFLFLAITGMVLSTLLIGGIVKQIYGSRNHRMKILEQALQSGTVDAQIKQVLIAELTKPGPLGRALRAIWTGVTKVWAGGRLLVAAGWIGVFFGIGYIFSGDRDATEIGIPFTLLSFGVLTVPFALRELETRRHAPTHR